MPKEQGLKHDHDKVRPTLFPIEAMEEILKVLEFGARKYSKDNWRLVPNGKQRYLDAALRHISAYRRGYMEDEETEYHHLAHAVCCLTFIMELDREQG